MEKKCKIWVGPLVATAEDIGLKRFVHFAWFAIVVAGIGFTARYMGYSVRFPGGSSDSHSAEPETKSRESLIHIKDAEIVRSVTERTVITDRRLLRGVAGFLCTQS